MSTGFGFFIRAIADQAAIPMITSAGMKPPNTPVATPSIVGLPMIAAAAIPTQTVSASMAAIMRTPRAVRADSCRPACGPAEVWEASMDTLYRAQPRSS
jgi:hypothetical protein